MASLKNKAILRDVRALISQYESDSSESESDASLGKAKGTYAPRKVLKSGRVSRRRSKTATPPSEPEVEVEVVKKSKKSAKDAKPPKAKKPMSEDQKKEFLRKMAEGRAKKAAERANA